MVDDNNQLQPANPPAIAMAEVRAFVGANQARVNVAYAGQNGDLPDPVALDAADGDIKQWVTEALRTGGIPGLPAAPTANLTDFVVDRFPPTEARPYAIMQIRPKTPFGVALRL